MKTGRTTSEENSNKVRRSGHSHRKLSPKMKRRLRRERKKARVRGLSCEHYHARMPNPAVAKEAEEAGMGLAQYVERKSREQNPCYVATTKDKELNEEIKVSVISLLEEALESEGRKYVDSERADLEATYNEDLGQLELFRFRTVVDEVSDHEVEVSLEVARESDPDSIIGDDLGIKVEAPLDKLSFVRIIEVSEVKPQVVFATLEGSEDIYQDCLRNTAAMVAWYYV